MRCRIRTGARLGWAPRLCCRGSDSLDAKPLLFQIEVTATPHPRDLSRPLCTHVAKVAHGATPKCGLEHAQPLSCPCKMHVHLEFQDVTLCGNSPCRRKQWRWGPVGSGWAPSPVTGVLIRRGEDTKRPTQRRRPRGGGVSASAPRSCRDRGEPPGAGGGGEPGRVLADPQGRHHMRMLVSDSGLQKGESTSCRVSHLDVVLMTQPQETPALSISPLRSSRASDSPRSSAHRLVDTL